MKFLILAAFIFTLSPVINAVDTLTQKCFDEYDKAKKAGCVDKYTKGKLLGHGAWGDVFKATDKQSGRVVAWKCKRRGSDEVLIEEYCKQKEGSHQNVVEAIDITCHNGEPCMALELADGGTLEDLAKKQPNGKLTENVARPLFKEWVEGVKHFHDLGMAVRDIKPNNVLIVNGHVKLADFGHTCSVRSKVHKYNCGGLSTLKGAPRYLTLESRLFESEPDIRTRDVYALGVSFKELVAAVAPSAFFMHDIENECDYSEEFLDLVKKMTSSSYKERIGIYKVATHAWIEGRKFTDYPGAEENKERKKKCAKILSKGTGNGYEDSPGQYFSQTPENNLLFSQMFPGMMYGR